jgi:hypothetical protein
MQIFRSRGRSFLVVAGFIALVPFLMAPPPGGCPSCQTIASWEGALDPWEPAPHQHQIVNGVECFAYLNVEDGGGTLSVSGQAVSQLWCRPSQVQGDTLCTFKASGSGTATMTVTGGNQGLEYLLELGYP